VWANDAARKCAELEASGGDLEEVLSIVAGAKARKLYEEGDLDVGVISCGQGVGLARDIPTLQELFDRIMEEAGGIAGRLAAN
jgi:nitronate monooxygenase